MRQYTQHWNRIAVHLEVVYAGVGQTGLTASATIQRLTDNFYLQSGGLTWSAAFFTLPMSDVGGGAYIYEIDPSALVYEASLRGYRVKVTEPTNYILEHSIITGMRSEWDEPKTSHIISGSFGDGIGLSGGDIATIVSQVWGAPTSAHFSPGTLGRAVTTTQGLVQGNQRLKSLSYNAEGGLVSAQLAIYPTSSDALNDTNALDTFTMTYAYNGSGDLTSLLSRN